MDSDLVLVHPNTVRVTHIFDGEEAVTGGESGQIWVATFADRVAAEWFVKFANEQGVMLRGQQPANSAEKAARGWVSPDGVVRETRTGEFASNIPAEEYGDFRRFCVGCGFEHGPVYPDCVWLKDV